jgi:hypothetical protein
MSRPLVRPMRVRVPAVRMSTATLQAVYPWHAPQSLGTDGVFIGRAVTGEAWCYDPWALYQAGVITGPNMLVAGQIGSGKSALIKTLLWRQRAVGRRAWVIDPKGEYAALAAACGVTPIRLGGGSPARINPLDVGATRRVSCDEVARRRVGLVTALAAATLDRPLSPDETTACELAVTAATGAASRAVTLPDVVQALLRPTEGAAVAAVAMTAADAAAAGRAPALALRRLVHGDLAGIFDGPTTVDPAGDVVVLDLSAVDGDVEPLVMLCAHTWLTQTVAACGDNHLLVVLDEAWRVLRHVHIARWLRASWKLSRAWGVANIAVIHRLSDLAAAGPVGSEQHQLAQGLLADSQTRVIYAQPADVVDDTAAALELTDAEAAALPGFPRGRGLWHVGDRRSVVDHLVTAAELAITDTDQHMR